MLALLGGHNDQTEAEHGAGQRPVQREVEREAVPREQRVGHPWSQSPMTGPWLDVPPYLVALRLSLSCSWGSAASSSASFALGRFRTPRSHAASQEWAMLAPVAVAAAMRSTEDESRSDAETWIVERCSAWRTTP